VGFSVATEELQSWSRQLSTAESPRPRRPLQGMAGCAQVPLRQNARSIRWTLWRAKSRRQPLHKPRHVQASASVGFTPRRSSGMAPALRGGGGHLRRAGQGNGRAAGNLGTSICCDSATARHTLSPTRPATWPLPSTSRGLFCC